MIFSVVRNTWSIFLGLAILMLGNGLQGTLTGWRANFEGFSPTVTGLVIMGFSIGFLLGSLITPSLVRGVGHIRVFAAFASLASACILIQILFIDAILWFFMRLVIGICFAGAYVIVESWLNARSDDGSRGRVLSVYMIVTYCGMAGGQWMMMAADPSTKDLFMVASILMSFALVPVLIGRISAPVIEFHRKLTVTDLLRDAPAGTAALFITAIGQGALFGMSAVYASRNGMDVNQVSLFVSSFILLGALIQWPVGALSDRMDRRFTILLAAMAASLLATINLAFEFTPNVETLVFGLMGAASMVIYPLAVAQINDRLEPDQMVGAGGTVALLFGLGSILGPPTMGYLMDALPGSGFFIHLLLVHGLIVAASAVFLYRQKPVPVEEQSHYQAVPPRATPLAMETIAHEAEEYQLHHGPESEEQKEKEQKENTQP
ncbi:MAG: MFS transporter [Gammaproteobacteria bacterium]